MVKRGKENKEGKATVPILTVESEDEAPEQVTFTQSLVSQKEHEQSLKAAQPKTKKKKNNKKPKPEKKLETDTNLEKKKEKEKGTDILKPISQDILNQVEDTPNNLVEEDEEEDQRKVIQSLEKVQISDKVKTFNGVQAQKVQPNNTYLLPDIEPSTKQLQFLDETLYLIHNGFRRHL